VSPSLTDKRPHRAVAGSRGVEGSVPCARPVDACGCLSPLALGPPLYSCPPPQYKTKDRTPSRAHSIHVLKVKVKPTLATTTTTATTAAAAAKERESAGKPTRKATTLEGILLLVARGVVRVVAGIVPLTQLCTLPCPVSVCMHMYMCVRVCACVVWDGAPPSQRTVVSQDLVSRIDLRHLCLGLGHVVAAVLVWMPFLRQAAVGWGLDRDGTGEPATSITYTRTTPPRTSLDVGLGRRPRHAEHLVVVDALGIARQLFCALQALHHLREREG
jgi:hypothetical protein